MKTERPTDQPTKRQHYTDRRLPSYRNDNVVKFLYEHSFGKVYIHPVLYPAFTYTLFKSELDRKETIFTVVVAVEEVEG